MARKGKELAVGGWRIQVDPLVLVSRILLRQKFLLGVIAFLGGVATIGTYLALPKIFTSRSNILIRYENFEEGYLQKLLNVSVGYFGSDLEMMVLINELDLYAKMRARLPYEMALREIRKELGIKSQTRNIEITFKSPDPVLAQRVVAFVTERLIGKMAELNEAPFNRDLDAVVLAINDVEPRKTRAETKLYEFVNAHPEIASRLAELVAPSSPSVGAMSEIRRAELELAAIRTGRPVEASAPKPTRAGPETTKLLELEGQLVRLKEKYTDDHPEVLNMIRAIRDQRVKSQAEQRGAEELVPAGADPEEIKKQRIARAEERLKQLIEQKVELDKQAIKKPQLQREYAELSLASSTYQSELRDLLGRRELIRRERVLAANRFQENFQLVDPARVPQLPSEPDRNKLMFIGMALTAILGILVAAVREATRQVFVDAGEFEEQTGLQVFAVLPNIKKEGA